MGMFLEKIICTQEGIYICKDCVAKNNIYVYQHYGLLLCACLWYFLK